MFRANAVKFFQNMFKDEWNVFSTTIPMCF